MLNSGKKFRALRDKKKNILTLVLSEKNFLNETKKHNPPFKLNGRSLIYYNLINLHFQRNQQVQFASYVKNPRKQLLIF
jgi:hypothetical protein